MGAWKETYNYKKWLSLNLSAFDTLLPGHPFYSNQLSINDMKLRFSQ